MTKKHFARSSAASVINWRLHNVPDELQYSRFAERREKQNRTRKPTLPKMVLSELKMAAGARQVWSVDTVKMNVASW